VNRHKAVALLLSSAIIFIIGIYLIDLNPFQLALPAGPTFDIDEVDAIAQAVGDIISSYRAIDVLIQVTLLLAAVVGATALFRQRPEEDAH
jgi:hypothetical protein